MIWERHISGATNSPNLLRNDTLQGIPTRDDENIDDLPRQLSQNTGATSRNTSGTSTSTVVKIQDLVRQNQPQPQLLITKQQQLLL